MFERYTEKARRTIFFARFEASNFGSPYIEAEHLLLGLLREDNGLSPRFFSRGATQKAVRHEIEKHQVVKERIPTSADLPLSNESKHALAYAGEEAARLAHSFIGTEHLLLGLLREEKSFAAELLRRFGVEADAVRKDVQDSLRADNRRDAAAGHATFGYFQLLLKVTDLEKSVKFYARLGFTVVRGLNSAILTGGGGHLRLEQSAVVEHALSFPGANMQASLSVLEAAGIPFEKQTGPDGRPQALLHDPDGNTISLQFR